MKNRLDDAEKDAFWDLAALAPKKKNGAPLRPFSRAVMPADVDVAPAREPVFSQAETADSAADEKHDRTRLTGLSYDETADVDSEEYTPADNDLVTRVRILRRRGEYHFYGQFRKDAIRYLGEEGKEAPFAHYFSYIPQYSQLTAAQRAYYFYWRGCVRRGEYPLADESYFYLLVYEIINLPDYIPPKEGVLQLCRVWSAYRKAFPRVDKYMAEWVADYCLVHALPAPIEELRPFLGKILPLVSFREFYLGGMGKLTVEGANTALAFFSDYRFRDSRYAAGENAAFFEEHIPRAIIPILSDVFQNGDKIFRTTAVTHLVRDAFCGSLCAHHIRSRIEVSYYAISDVAPLRAALTAAVKYAENKIRAILSVKSRLSVPALSPAYRQHIDDYFSSLTGKLRAAAPKEANAYDHLYDAPTRGISVEAARAIEEASWDTVRILLPEEEENVSAPLAPPVNIPAPHPVPPVSVPMPSVSSPTAPATDAPLFSEEERAYLSCLFAGDTAGAHALLARLGKLPEELASHINELALEFFGDVILDTTADTPIPIDDYQEEVSAWILS